MRDIVPFTELAPRVQEHGRIRLGVKTGKAMKSIKTFRFTSQDRQAIEQLAGLYGGTAKPWHDDRANPPDQFEVISTVDEVPILLPPGSLSQFYETWAGSGVTRRCDGLACEVPSSGPDAELVKVPCLCKQQGVRTCKPYTRLQVVLPEIRFGGVWRVETKGWNAAHELPAMERLLTDLQMGQERIIEAKLRVEVRSDINQGKRRHFVVPVIVLPDTVRALAAGNLGVGQLGQAPAAPALTAGAPATPNVEVPAPEPEADWYDHGTDDDVVEAELVDEGSSSQPADTDWRKRAQTKLVIQCEKVAAMMNVDDTALRHAIAKTVSDGATESSKALSDEQRSKALDRLEQAATGEIQLKLNDDGTLRVVKNR